MTRFELFCLVFYALDAAWDDSHSKQLGQYLSDANPFLWGGQSSANPAVYDEFCKSVAQEIISVEDSYDVACGYINTLSGNYVKAVLKAFSTVTKEKWLDGAKKYLSRAHE